MNNDIFTKTYLSILNENCEGCGKPEEECECEKNTEECNEQADACPKCGSPDCDGSCECDDECNEEAETCPECGKPCAECECENKAEECNEETETCPECGKPTAECECDDECNECGDTDAEECNESCCKPQKPAKEITVESEDEDAEEYESEDEEEEDEDGWPEDTIETFKDVLSEVDSLSYELKNCVRGTYTGCDTKEELAAYIQDLIDNFQEALDQFNA